MQHNSSMVLVVARVLSIIFMAVLLLGSNCIAEEGKPFLLKGSMCAATKNTWPMTITLVDINSSLRSIDKNLGTLDVQGIPYNPKLEEAINMMSASGKCTGLALYVYIYKKESFGYYSVFDSWADEVFAKAAVVQKQEEEPENAPTRKIEALLSEKRWDAAYTAATDLNQRLSQADVLKWQTATLGATDFLKKFDNCIDVEVTSNNDNEVERCYQNLIQSTWKDTNIASLPFSKAFIDELDKKRDLALEWIEDVKQKIKIEEKKQRKEKERVWGREADDLLSAAYEKATEAPEYVLLKTTCSICILSEQKMGIEKAIKDEKSYSKKYGVINLSKVDKYKQAIMQIDQAVAENKKEYKKRTGKMFNVSQCKNQKMIEACDNSNQDKIYKEIALKIRDENLNRIQDQNKKNYMIKYMQSKPAY